MSSSLWAEFEKELEIGELDPKPGDKDLRGSRLYFAELEDALMHYASPGPPGSFVTLTVRTNSEGVPSAEAVSETRFPPLDDLEDHLKRLHYSARQLDKLSPDWWKEFWNRRLKGDEVPCIAMAIAMCGEGNNKRFSFRRDAFIYRTCLGRLSWSNTNNPDNYRDMAE